MQIDLTGAIFSLFLHIPNIVVYTLPQMIVADFSQLPKCFFFGSQFEGRQHTVGYKVLLHNSLSWDTIQDQCKKGLRLKPISNGKELLSPCRQTSYVWAREQRWRAWQVLSQRPGSIQRSTKKWNKYSLAFDIIFRFCGKAVQHNYASQLGTRGVYR